MELPDPPEGWHLGSLIYDGVIRNDNPSDVWSVHLSSGSEYVMGYGSTPRYAMLDALAKIEDDDVFISLSGMSKKPEIDLVAALGIKPKKERIGGF